MVSRITEKKPQPKAAAPDPKEKLKIKTSARVRDDDWYEAAFKRFSISHNRANLRNDPLAALNPPIKPGF